jgi:hypothetical protein
MLLEVGRKKKKSRRLNDIIQKTRNKIPGVKTLPIKVKK